MNFSQFVENAAIQTAIQKLLSQAEQLPDTDDDKDLFGPKNRKKILVHYYKELLQNMDEPLANLLSAIPLNDPAQVYNTINSGGHPVRDYLIVKSMGANRVQP